MASDNRDWYRAWWRKRTGYTEKAAFRLGHHEVVARKTSSAWKRNLLLVVLVLLGFVALAALT